MQNENQNQQMKNAEGIQNLDKEKKKLSELIDKKKKLTIDEKVSLKEQLEKDYDIIYEKIKSIPSNIQQRLTAYEVKEKKLAALFDKLKEPQKVSHDSIRMITKELADARKPPKTSNMLIEGLSSLDPYKTLRNPLILALSSSRPKMGLQPVFSENSVEVHVARLA